MEYRVKSDDGELTFKSLYEVQRALQQGLVAPHDQLREGDGAWRQIVEVPALRNDARLPKGFWRTGNARWVVPPLALLVVSLLLIFRSGYQLVGLGIAALSALLLSQLMFKVSSKRRLG